MKNLSFPRRGIFIEKLNGKFTDKHFHSEDATKDPTRNAELHKLNTFRNTLSSKLSEKGRHAKELEFMASNGVRQLGESRIGIFSNRQRPDPFHHEVNNW